MLFHSYSLVFLLVVRSAASAASSPAVFSDAVERGPSMLRPLPHQHVEYPTTSEGGITRRELQADQDEVTYAPIRIVFDTRLIEERRGEEDFIDSQIDSILQDILPAATKLWSDHLSVVPTLSGITVERQKSCNANNNLPEEDGDEITFPDADLVILVAGDQASRCPSRERLLAYANICALDDRLDRPVVGRIDFCLGNRTQILSTELNGIYLKDVYAPRTGAIFREEHLQLNFTLITAHEISHILGFAYVSYGYFRDENGEPRSPRDSNGDPNITSSGYYASDEVVRLVEGDEYIVTPKVRAVTRNHFRCSTLFGARLNEYGHHWHERWFFGSLMGAAYSDSSENSLSLASLALMEDSGWYRVDYRGGSQPAFGIGAGCEFVSQPCIQDDRVPSWSHGEFCDRPIAQLENEDADPEFLNTVDLYCDPAHYAWTACDLVSLLDESVEDVSYFSDRRLAPFWFKLADNCPLPDAGLGLDCRRGEDPYIAFYEGESVGTNSRCINAFHHQQLENSTSNAGSVIFRPACMTVTCDMEAGVVRIGQGASEQVCTADGEILPAIGPDGASFICPRLAALCPEIFACPEDCWGRGECVFPDGISGEDESYSARRPFCQCFEETNNTDFACAPPYIERPTASPTISPTSPAPSVLRPTLQQQPSLAQTSSESALRLNAQTLLLVILSMVALLGF